MRFSAEAKIPIKQMTAAREKYRRNLRAAAIIATDRATAEARKGIQERIQSTGLGRLAGAVGQTSMRKLGGDGDPYGVIFAKGGDESLAGGALESYSRGSTIRPGPGKLWLAFPTKAVPRFISVGGRRQRNTPDLYMRSGLMTSIGRLEFRPIGPDRAIWVIKRVSISPKTGQAKALGSGRTRSRIAQKEVIAFIGIRVTRRAARFDKDGVVGFYARRVPRYMTEALSRIYGERVDA